MYLDIKFHNELETVTNQAPLSRLYSTAGCKYLCCVSSAI